MKRLLSLTLCLLMLFSTGISLASADTTKEYPFHALSFSVPSEWEESEKDTDYLSFIIRGTALLAIKYQDFGYEIPDYAFQIGPKVLDDAAVIELYSMLLSSMCDSSSLRYENVEVITIDDMKACIADIAEIQGPFRGKVVTFLKGKDFYFIYVLEALHFSDTLSQEFDTVLDSISFGGTKAGSSSSSGNNTTSQKQATTTPFTNAYGTPTTKCAHVGCNNYIASSGDTNCCTKHSHRCLSCGKYIDEDATYCMSCISKSLDSTSGNSNNSTDAKTATCNYCHGTGRADGGKCPWCNGTGKTYDNIFNDLLG